MKFILKRNNKPDIEIDSNNISRISGLSQSNLIVCMKNKDTHSGYMLVASDE